MTFSLLKPKIQQYSVIVMSTFMYVSGHVSGKIIYAGYYVCGDFFKYSNVLSITSYQPHRGICNWVQFRASVLTVTVCIHTCVEHWVYALLQPLLVIRLDIWAVLLLFFLPCKFLDLICHYIINFSLQKSPPPRKSTRDTLPKKVNQLLQLAMI